MAKTRVEIIQNDFWVVIGRSAMILWFVVGSKQTNNKKHETGINPVNSQNLLECRR